jgi:hypothetical protein
MTRLPGLFNCSHYNLITFDDPACPPAQTAVNYSRAAFRLLHRQYPGSEWAMKTQYYF